MPEFWDGLSVGQAIVIVTLVWAGVQASWALAGLARRVFKIKPVADDWTYEWTAHLDAMRDQLGEIRNYAHDSYDVLCSLDETAGTLPSHMADQANATHQLGEANKGLTQAMLRMVK